MKNCTAAQQRIGVAGLGVGNRVLPPTIFILRSSPVTRFTPLLLSLFRSHVSLPHSLIPFYPFSPLPPLLSQAHATMSRSSAPGKHLLPNRYKVFLACAFLLAIALLADFLWASANFSSSSSAHSSLNPSLDSFTHVAVSTSPRHASLKVLVGTTSLSEHSFLSLLLAPLYSSRPAFLLFEICAM
jgi:hypothetical protein